MKKILIPVDFSEYSYKACQFALNIANIYKSEIHLFYSHYQKLIYSDNNFSAGLDSNTLYNEQIFTQEKDARKDLKILKEKLNLQIKNENLKDISIDNTFITGEPEFTIIDFCKEYKPDIILMGSRGKSNKGLFAGSISKKIMNNSKIPVLTVPDKSSITGFSEIMYLTDFEKTDKILIGKLIKLFSKTKIKIHCVHFNIHENKIEQNEKEMESLKSNIPIEYDNTEFNFTMVDSIDLNKDIAKFVNNKNINIIAFHSHKRNFLREIFTQKLTKKHLYTTNIPLLSFNVE